MAPHMRDSAQLRATAPLAPSYAVPGRHQLGDQEPPDSLRRQLGDRFFSLLTFAVILSLLAAPVATVEMTNGWTLETTLRHFAAAPGCGMARAVGLAPARTGQPGYWLWLDRDHDGISCAATGE